MAKIKLDFEILPTFNTQNLVVADTSQWLLIQGKPAIIEITLPGEDRYVTHFFKKNSVNVFNSNNLGISCPTCHNDELIDLPDGVYKVVLKGSPESYNCTKYFVKNDTLRLRLDELFLKGVGTCSDFGKETLNKLLEIDFLIKASESSLRLGDFETAQELYNNASTKINRLKSCDLCA